MKSKILFFEKMYEVKPIKLLSCQLEDYDLFLKQEKINIARIIYR